MVKPSLWHEAGTYFRHERIHNSLFKITKQNKKVYPMISEAMINSFGGKHRMFKENHQVYLYFKPYIYSYKLIIDF